MQAVNNFVIIKRIKEKSKTASGFIIDSAKKEIRYLKGKIVSVGNITQGLKVNDIIYYDKHAGYSVEVDSQVFCVIKQQDVVIVL
jgi:co-chaperonin GroES (HSP10)